MIRECLYLLGVLLMLLPGSAATHVDQRTGPSRPTGISGRVLDPSGRPVPFAIVSLLWDRDSANDGGRLAYSVGLRSRTDERGAFRFDSLNPGPYYVVAFPPNFPATAARESNRRGHAVTYHPSAIRVEDAKAVIVVPSTVVTADISLVSARIGEISGSVIGSNGRPVSRGSLLVARGDGLFGLDSNSVTIARDGTFLVLDVPPGTYFLHWREGVWPVPQDVIPRVSGARVVVADRDVTNVRVLPIRMVKASGRVIVDPLIRKSTEFSTLSISASPANVDGNPGPQRPGKIRSDLTFEFHTWPGLGHVRVLLQRGGEVLTTVRLNGVDVTKTGIDFRDGQEIRGLEIVLSDRPLRPSPMVRPQR